MLSDNYKKVLEETHKNDESWGSSAGNYAHEVHLLAKELGARTILDYGCGKKALSDKLGDKYKIYNYDPGLDIDERKKCELVACIDVLEHVEPDMLDDVLKDIKSNTLKGAYFIIGIAPAQKILSDGRNAHLIIKDINWWAEKLETHFSTISLHPIRQKFLKVMAYVE